jgi:hypothetical protein
VSNSYVLWYQYDYFPHRSAKRKQEQRSAGDRTTPSPLLLSDSSSAQTIMPNRWLAPSLPPGTCSRMQGCCDCNDALMMRTAHNGDQLMDPTDEVNKFENAIQNVIFVQE